MPEVLKDCYLIPKGVNRHHVLCSQLTEEDFFGGLLHFVFQGFSGIFYRLSLGDVRRYEINFTSSYGDNEERRVFASDDLEEVKQQIRKMV